MRKPPHCETHMNPDNSSLATLSTIITSGKPNKAIPQQPKRKASNYHHATKASQHKGGLLEHCLTTITKLGQFFQRRVTARPHKLSLLCIFEKDVPDNKNRKPRNETDGTNLPNGVVVFPHVFFLRTQPDQVSKQKQNTGSVPDKPTTLTKENSSSR